MKPHYLFAILAMTFMIAGCHRSEDALPAPPAPASSPEAPKAASLCDQKTASYKAKKLIEEPVQNITIERHFQRVIRKDCQKQVVSNKIETVKSPRLDLVLKPDRVLARKAGYVRIFDSETCTERSTRLPNKNGILAGNLKPITGKTTGEIEVKMDLAEAWFTFKVTQDINHIYYSYFEGCKVESEKSAECIPDNEFDSGVFKVFVTYVEKTLPGESVIEASGCDQNEKLQ